MDLGLSGKTALVAAASRGLGYAAAAELVREGAAVAICSRDARAVGDAVEKLRSLGPEGGTARVFGCTADLSTPDGPASFVAAASEGLGGIDILVANNGGPPPGAAATLKEDAWRAGFEATFLSAQRLVAAVLPGMRERRWGRIVLVTSVSVKQPIENLAVSTAMRSAVTGFAKTLADEVAADGITVNSVAPGSTRTERLESLLGDRARRSGRTVEEVTRELEAGVPARRVGRPEEFAAAVAFLASERASYITGVVLPVDGGLVRSLI